MLTEPPPIAEIISILTRTVAEVQASSLSGFSDLSLRQVTHLEAVARLGHPTLSEFARELRISKPSATAAVERLEQAGYVEKVRSDADRRLFHLHLTPKGHSLSATHEQVHQFIAGALTASLSEAEKEQLALLLNKIIRSLA